MLIATTTTPSADIKLLVSGNGGVSSGSYFSFRGDYGNVSEPAAHAIKFDSTISASGGLHLYSYGGTQFDLGGQPRINFTQAGLVGVGTTNPSWEVQAHKASGSVQIAAKNVGGNANFYAEASSGNTAKITLMQAGVSSYDLRSGSADALQIYRDSSELLRITSSGDIVTQGLTGTSFDNDGSNTKIVEITGDGTAGEYAVLNISGNQNADNASVGALKFINRENSNSSTGANANSRQVGLIAAYSVTSDTNAGDDSGGYMQFATKPESGGISEAMRIDSSGRILIGGTSTEGHSAADELTISNTTSGADMGITLRSATNGQGAIYFSDGTSGDAEYRGIINYNHTSDFLNFYTAAGVRLTIDSSGRVLIGTGTSKSVGSGQYAKLNVEGLSLIHI